MRREEAFADMANRIAAVDLNQSQGEMFIRRIPVDQGRPDFNVRTGELYLAALACPHHLRNVDPTLALV